MYFFIACVYDTFSLLPGESLLCTLESLGLVGLCRIRGLLRHFLRTSKKLSSLEVESSTISFGFC